MPRELRGIALAVAEGALEAAIKAYSDFSPPPPPSVPPSPPQSPPAPLIASVNERQPDALVFLGLTLSLAIPGGMLFRVAEELTDDLTWEEAVSYEKLPVWLLAAYAFSAGAFGELFRNGRSASALERDHYALASLAALCALRHTHRMCNLAKRASGAVLLSFLVAFSVVLFFRTSLRTERCKTTMMVLTVFCAAPCWRAFHRKRHAAQGDRATEKARQRSMALSWVLLLGVFLQPWLGLCGPAASWAESVQMFGELTALSLATDSLWM